MYQIVELQKWAGWSRLPLSREEDCVVTANLGDFLYIPQTPASSTAEVIHAQTKLPRYASGVRPTGVDLSAVKLGVAPCRDPWPAPTPVPRIGYQVSSGVKAADISTSSHRLSGSAAVSLLLALRWGSPILCPRPSLKLKLTARPRVGASNPTIAMINPTRLGDTPRLRRVLISSYNRINAPRVEERDCLAATDTTLRHL